MYMTEISHDDFDKLSCHIEDGLDCFGEAMRCIKKMRERHGMRGGMRSGSYRKGSRGERDMYDDDDEVMYRHSIY